MFLPFDELWTKGPVWCILGDLLAEMEYNIKTFVFFGALISSLKVAVFFPLAWNEPESD